HASFSHVRTAQPRAYRLLRVLPGSARRRNGDVQVTCRGTEASPSAGPEAATVTAVSTVACQVRTCGDRGIVKRCANEERAHQQSRPTTQLTTRTPTQLSSSTWRK